jgi:integrase
MLRLAAELGLRRAEVAQVHSRDLLDDLGGTSLLVHGKGSRERIMPLPGSLAADLRALPFGYAFPGADDGHLSPRWVGKIVGRLLPEGYTMHSLRHRFGTRAYALSKDMFTVQELLGHASPSTTRTYVLLEDSAKRGVIDQLAAAS